MVKSIAFSLLSFASSTILAFFVSPLILKQLGDTRYGVWGLFGELLTYYGLLDFGIRGAVNYFVGRSLASEDSSAVKRYTSSAFVGLLGLGLAAFVVSVSLVFIFQDALVPDGAHRLEVIGGATTFLLIFCAGLPLEVFAATLSGSRRVFMVSSSEIVARLVSTALMVLGLMYAPNILVLCAAQLIGRVLYWSVNRRNTRKYVPEAVISFRAASFTTVREMVSYGSKNLIIDLAWLLANRKDVMLTTIFLGPQWVATFAFARLLVQSIFQACSSITQVVRPNLVHHWARKEFDQGWTIYYAIARYSSFVVLMPTAFLVPFGRDFLALWIGERYVQQDWMFRADIVLMVLLGAQIPRAMQSISYQLLFATHKQTSLSWLIAGEAVVDLGLAIWLIQVYGTVGLAIATFVPMFTVHVFMLPLIMRRILGLSIRRYVTEGVGTSVIAALIVAAFGFVLRSWIPPTTWRLLFLDAGIITLLSLAAGIAFVIRRQDRTWLMSKASVLLNRARGRSVAMSA